LRAIISVHDKKGIGPFARGLQELGWEVFSTGGTKKALEEAGVKVKSISDITSFPEILDGRVKTLHPKVHGGILARRDLPRHREEMKKQGIEPIDLVAVNLYPFRETVARGAELDEALENIDIGGPTMLRAAAKNFPHVLVVVHPGDYEEVLGLLRQEGVPSEVRRRLAGKAFQHVAAYDAAIASYLRQEEGFPQELVLSFHKLADLRYGENPHQKAAFYAEERPLSPSLALARKLGGKELSYNNILDLDSALAAVREFAEPACAIIKHNNACGLAVHADLAEAYRRALAGDPVAAFGGVVALNRPLDLATAQEIDKTHYDGLLAPDFDPQALNILGRKKDLIILAMGPISPDGGGFQLRKVAGGLLAQGPDVFLPEEFRPRTVTRRPPTSQEREDLFFAWRVVKHIKSNAIVLARDQALVGMGAGQPSRVVSVDIALKKAGDRAKGSVLGSDAFFPFPDGVELAGKAGVTAIMQPGGSVRDTEAIEMADAYNMAMVFTGVRHFRH
jgi:phosphoribosylaminoimidazolecarboxamide formyltransferase/IMP cyclohydrolase